MGDMPAQPRNWDTQMGRDKHAVGGGTLKTLGRLQRQRVQPQRKKLSNEPVVNDLGVLIGHAYGGFIAAQAVPFTDEPVPGPAAGFPTYGVVVDIAVTAANVEMPNALGTGLIPVFAPGDLSDPDAVATSSIEHHEGLRLQVDVTLAASGGQAHVASFEFTHNTNTVTLRSQLTGICTVEGDDLTLSAAAVVDDTESIGSLTVDASATHFYVAPLPPEL